MNRLANTAPLLVFLLFFSVVSARADPTTDQRSLLSQSTFIRLVDPQTHIVDPNRFAYLPAGTWVKTLGKTVSELNDTLLLIWAANGVLGYIPKTKLWVENDFRRFNKMGTIAIFQRNYNHVQNASEIFNFVVGFTRAETYKVVATGIDTVSISVNLVEKLVDNTGKHFLDVKPGTTINTYFSVPSRTVKVIDFTGYPTKMDIQFAPFFKKSIVDGIAGIEKPCRHKKSRVLKTKVGGGFNLKKFFLSLDISGERETEDIEVFSEDESVIRTYYTREGYGVYRLTQSKDCRTGHYEFSFLKPEGEEVPVTKDWAKLNELQVDSTTGKIKVTCPRQFFKFEDALTRHGFSTDEAAFTISEIGLWKELSQPGCS